MISGVVVGVVLHRLAVTMATLTELQPSCQALCCPVRTGAGRAENSHHTHHSHHTQSAQCALGSVSLHENPDDYGPLLEGRQFHLGSMPPRIGGMKAYSNSANTASLETTVLWGSKCQVLTRPLPLCRCS